MRAFIHPLFLSVVILLVLNACGTTGSRQDGAVTIEPGTATVTDTGDGQDSRYHQQRDSSAHVLAEVARLSRSMIGYQSEMALEILRALESVPSGQLATMIDNPFQDPELTGWLEVSLIARTTLINDRSVSAAARAWANEHDGHVITREIFPELLTHYKALFPVPAQVAILLPTQGGLAAAAKAIRDGILAAYLEQPGESVIRFYASGETSESALAAYMQAREDGAMQIIGPLRIGSTRALSSMEDQVVPVLLLNEPSEVQQYDQQRTSIVSSLSLSQTEEAAAIAGKALAQGQKQALVLVPDNAWGTRIETAFSTVFEDGDGNIAATSRFNRAANDQSAMLTQLLRIDQSKQRKTDLQSLLGVPLTFEPRRRNDFDFVFLAATPAEGRELKPLLRFHNAGDIPVYAMGRVYSGAVERTADRDLNDIIFPSTPWQLQAASETTMLPDSVRGGTFGNLYALGQDAWRLLPWIPLMQKDPDLWFAGNVGALRLRTDGRMYREPAWAKFSSGRPLPYQWPGTY